MNTMPESEQVNGKYHTYKYKLINGKVEIQINHI